MELLVRTRNGVPVSFSRATNSAAPGMARCSWTSTPSMSINQVSMRRSVTAGNLRLVAEEGQFLLVGARDPARRARDPVAVAAVHEALRDLRDLRQQVVLQGDGIQAEAEEVVVGDQQL